MGTTITGIPLAAATPDGTELLECVQGGNTSRITLAQIAALNNLPIRMTAVEAGQIGGMIGYTTLALLNADLVHPANALAIVTNDATPANNTTYIKLGASGAGSWQVAADRITAITTQLAGYVAAGLPIKAATPVGYSWALLDANGMVALGVKTDGTVVIHDAVITTMNATATNQIASTVVSKGGYYASEMLLIPSYGQSRSLGQGGGVFLQTTAQATDSLMFNSGVRTQQGAGTVAANHASLIPLVEVLNASTGDGESPMGQSLAMIKTLVKTENNIDYTQQTYQFIGSAPGLSNTAIAPLSKGTTPYQKLIDDVTYGFALAQASGKSFIVPSVYWAQGEADYTLGTTYATYLTKIKQLRIDLDTDIKAITGQLDNVILITDQCVDATGLYNPSTVAFAQLQATIDDPLIRISHPTDADDHLPSANPHYTSVGYSTNGAWKAVCYKRSIIDGRAWGRFVPTKIWRQGNSMYAQFSPTVSPIVLDTTTLLIGAVTNYGFTMVTSANVDIPVTAVTLVGPGLLKCTAGSAIPAAAKMRYGYVYGGNLRDSQGDALQWVGKTRRRMDNWCLAFEQTIVN